MAEALFQRATTAANRIEEGIKILADGQALAAFRMANKVMARAARRRFGPMQGWDEAGVEAPTWRPFQLAFVLTNLPGIVEPTHHDREVVDLALLPDRRRQDRSLPGARRLHARPPAAEEPRLCVAGPERPDCGTPSDS